MPLTIGIDPGTATTGYGFVRQLEDGSLTAVAFGVLTTSKDLSAAQRLSALHEQLGKLLKKYKPESAAVEKLFFQKNIATAMAVGQARGVIMLALHQAKVAIQEYTPNEVKLAVAGYGSAEKRQVQQMVRVL